MTRSYLEIAGLILLLLFFLVVGIICLGWPEKVQKYVLNFYDSATGLSKFNPFLNWMRSLNYITSLRIIGVLALVAAFIVLYAIFKK